MHIPEIRSYVGFPTILKRVAECRTTRRVMTRAEHCRAKAEECDQLARTMHDPKTKSQLEKLAADWRALAAEIDKGKQTSSLVLKRTNHEVPSPPLTHSEHEHL